MFKKFNKVIKAVEDWSLGDEATTWVNLMAMSRKGDYFTINEGAGGTSKSRCSTELAKELKLFTGETDELNQYHSPIVVFNGTSTDKGFFDFMKRYRDRCIILDDVSSLTTRQLGILKDIAGENKTTTWEKYGQDKPNTFIFTGTIIINQNTENKTNADIEAVKSRAFVSKFYKNPLQIMEKKHIFWDNRINKKEWDKKTWEIIREKIMEIKIVELNAEELALIKKWIENIVITHETNTSMRDDVNMLKFFTWWKSFWGVFNADIYGYGLKIMKEFYASGDGKQKSQVMETIEEYFEIHNTRNIRRLQLAHILSKKYGYTVRTAQTRITDSLLGGEIENEKDERWIQIAEQIEVPTIVIDKF